VIVLDGPLGTELDARGVDTGLPLWSARALIEAPEIVAAIHADYAAAGATVHTANTFRTKRRMLGAKWEPLARDAVRLARSAVPSGHRVAGSIAPLEDCYRPDLSPKDPEPEHHELAALLAEEGCDVLLCETYPHVGEAVAAVRAAVRTGVETWVGFTAGPFGDLLTPTEMREGARRAVDAGAAAVFVNCTPALETRDFLDALADLGVPIGAYANAGSADDDIGWKSSPEPGAEAYAALAESWRDAGASMIGGCCGTGPAHVRALCSTFR